MEKKIRRKSHPLMVQYLWDAITTIRNHKQLPSFDRIRRYMNRTHSMEADKVERHLEECTSDNLIIVSRKVGQKGSKVGVEQEGFRLPSPPDEPDSHDWYCFKCHEAGEVACCSKCYRVFHSQCLEAHDLPYHPTDFFVCPVCKKRMYQRTGGRSRIAREELNSLLLLSIARMKERLPVNILERIITAAAQKSNMFPNDRAAGQSQSKTEPNGINLSEPWRAQLLLHHQMDLATIEQKCQDGRYKSSYDFEIDALTITHNVTIFHGNESPIAEMTRQMLRDCQYDLSELDLCKDCFQYAAKKNERYWFCRPCVPPHELVYAKDEGYPYWPAKVIKLENGLYTVRFFGSNHHKATLDKNAIKPITVNINSLLVKRTSTAWNKAYEELKKHQEFLANGYHEDPPPPPPPPPPQPATYQHAFQPPPQPPPPPPPVFPQHYHPFHPPQQYHQYPQPPPHHLIHPHHQQHWEAVQSSEHHHRLVQSGLANPPLVHFNNSVKKENEAEVSRGKESSSKKNHHKDPPVLVKSAETSSGSDDSRSSAEKRVSESTSEEHTSPSSSSSRAKCPKKEPPVVEDVVSSSSHPQEHRTHSLGVQTSPRLMKNLIEELNVEHSPKKGKGNKDAALRELADKLRHEHELDKQRAIQLTIKQREKDMERIKEEFGEKLKEKVSETKRKQWCWSCESEAIYHCCWNTAYCSIECQQEHWHKEHKKNCRRKR